MSLLFLGLTFVTSAALAQKDSDQMVIKTNTIEETTINSCIDKMVLQKIQVDSEGYKGSYAIPMYRDRSAAKVFLENLILTSEDDDFRSAIEYCNGLGVKLERDQLDAAFTRIVHGLRQRQTEKSDEYFERKAASQDKSDH